MEILGITSIIAAFALMFIGAFGLLLSKAPFGYEDENGFHEVDENHFSFKPTLYPDDFEEDNELKILGDYNMILNAQKEETVTPLLINSLQRLQWYVEKGWSHNSLLDERIFPETFLDKYYNEIKEGKSISEIIGE